MAYSRFSVAALGLAVLVAIDGLLWGAQQAFGFGGFSRWGRTVGTVAPPALGLFTLALVGTVVFGRRRREAPRTLAWIVFALCLTVGYLIAQDGYSYETYLYRPGGLRGGCYTQLELWLRVPHDYSVIRNMEQAFGCVFFFASPLLLLADSLPRKGARRARAAVAIDGA